MPIVKQAPPVEQTIVVKTAGDYGVQAANDEWFAVQVEGLTPAAFAPGESYNIAVVKNAAGKSHIVKVLSGTLLNGTGGVGGTPGPHTGPLPATLPTLAATSTPLTAAVAAAHPVAATPKPAYVKAGADPDKMSKAEWAAKDRVVARESAIKSLLSSQWFANYAMPMPADKQKALVFELAAEIEAWFYRP